MEGWVYGGLVALGVFQGRPRGSVITFVNSFTVIMMIIRRSIFNIIFNFMLLGSLNHFWGRKSATKTA